MKNLMKLFVVGLMFMPLWALAQVTNAVVLTDLNLPEQLPGIVDWFLAGHAWSVVKYASIIIMIVQLIKTFVVLFGSKLPAKLAPALVALMGLLVLWEETAADGVISGSDWSQLIVALLATLGAFFGYKVLFSTSSKVQQAKEPK